MACEASVRKVAELLARRGWKAKKSTVGSWYLNKRRYLAGRWQEQKHPVDHESFDRWRTIFESQKYGLNTLERFSHQKGPDRELRRRSNNARRPSPSGRFFWGPPCD